MSELIKKGEPRELWSKEVKCTGEGNAMVNASAKVYPCASTIKIGYADVFATNTKILLQGGGRDDSYYESRKHTFAFKCGECHSVTNFGAENEIPNVAQFYAIGNGKPHAGKAHAEKPKQKSASTKDKSTARLKQLRKVFNGLSDAEKQALGISS